MPVEPKTQDFVLTEFDRSLLNALLTGSTIARAAADLHVSSRTVETRLATLRALAGVATLYSLGAWAERMGHH
jgi:DNA-binding NarL/FixJ family response regulator